MEKHPGQVRFPSTEGSTPPSEMFATVIRDLEQQQHAIAEIQRQTAKTRSDKAWEIGLKALVPLVLGIASWAGIQSSRIQHNHERLSLLEATRFTAADAHKLAAEIRLQMQTPPVWMQANLDRLEVKLDRVTEAIVQMGNRLVKVEAERGK